MVTVGSFDAKTHLPALLERVSKGETIQITKRGRPIAKIVPTGEKRALDPKETAEELRKMRKGVLLGKINARALKNEGRP